jgi:hypothetical protein
MQCKSTIGTICCVLQGNSWYYSHGQPRETARTRPKGGSEFYAKPLDISKANNVTLEHKLFFSALIGLKAANYQDSTAVILVEKTRVRLL